MTLSYIYAKFLKKIVRGKAIRSSFIDKSTKVNSGTTITNSKIGRYNNIGYDNEINNTEIGDFCSLSDHVYIGGAEHPINWVSTSSVFENVHHSGPLKKFATFDLPPEKRTYIGSDVWIGHNVSIKAGVRIGHGAVIGVGAVVTKDIPPYAIAVGCPAVVIKYRFDECIINDLLQTKWWELSPNDIYKVAGFIRNPIEFIEKIKKLKSE